MSKNVKKRGFTIIEVVLVLAIAGLIFLMVFIALPALQRNQRDTQRENDFGRAMAALTRFRANNRNRIPGEGQPGGVTAVQHWNTFRDRYLLVNNDTFEDPQTGTIYNFTIVNGAAGDPGDAGSGNLRVHIGATCDGEMARAVAGNRNVAIRMRLEGGGIICQSN
jgi:prepilin-type N-terminal cleavage/methylation domain-containing protein